ncbi:MAG: hypothetical protein WCS35_09375, partial [Sphaerochaeta sp.]
SYRQANEKMQEQQREFAQLQIIHTEQQKRQEEALSSIEEDAKRHITEELQSFVQQCYSEMGKILEMTLNKTDISFQNMMRVVSEYLKELSLRLEQAREVTKLLGASERESLLSFKEDLDALLQKTLKGEQALETMQGLEEKASSQLTLLHQETDQLQVSLVSMKTEKLGLLEKSKTREIPRSVVFAMALVDEACKSLEKEQAFPEEELSVIDEFLEEPIKTAEPAVEESLPSVVFAMALGEEAEDAKVELTQKPEAEREKHAVAENRRVEYLAESEEEVIFLDQEEEPSR